MRPMRQADAEFHAIYVRPHRGEARAFVVRRLRAVRARARMGERAVAHGRDHVPMVRLRGPRQLGVRGRIR